MARSVTLCAGRWAAASASDDDRQETGEWFQACCEIRRRVRKTHEFSECATEGCGNNRQLLDFAAAIPTMPVIKWGNSHFSRLP